ncbi:hypothetical protein GALMADRAFT_874176 [Galerina marginata CBS 339.88]|uniref:Uncharacterized protein n=1 Tax=Galerina marginata (strain CBS 339.88) TaxID=685588 RepID=A0A067TJ49_GALM3|nr:hypothetical protein GALMADRAFT_874176 [Galerina marginata CBS 339.88]
MNLQVIFTLLTSLIAAAFASPVAVMINKRSVPTATLDDPSLSCPIRRTLDDALVIDTDTTSAMNAATGESTVSEIFPSREYNCGPVITAQLMAALANKPGFNGIPIRGLGLSSIPTRFG